MIDLIAPALRGDLSEVLPRLSELREGELTREDFERQQKYLKRFSGVERPIHSDFLVGGLLDALGLTACDGLINGLLRYNDCVRDALVKYLQTKPGGLSGAGGYNPTTGTGSCSSGLCLLLKPVVDGFLRPLLDGVGKLLRDVLSEVLGLQLGRTDVHMQSIQCGRSQLVE